ncbi:MAG: hypothetical protein Q9222_006466 [Ikaeria aurantiellina]
MTPAEDNQSQRGTTHPSRTDEVTYNGNQYSIIREGLADILNPRSVQSTKGGSTKQSVFYNPIQQFNRDLSVLAIRVFAEDLAIIRRSTQGTKLQRSLKHASKGQKRKREEESEAAEDGRVKRSKGSNPAHEPHSVGLEDATASGAGTRKSTEGSYMGDVPKDGVSQDPARVEDTPGHGDQVLANHEGVPNGSHYPPPRQENGKTSDNDPHDHGCSPVTFPFRILDALSATGLRALRYAREIPQVTSVTANDLSPSATASIRLNAMYNDVSGKVQATTGDAKALMYHTITHASDLFHVIDLDPYGTAVPFLDAAVQAVPDGGLLCVTCTDAGVYASVGFPEKTYSQYGGVAWKGTQCHEAGLRLILNSVATSAARYGLAIEPLLSLNIDFYARLFVRLRKSPADTKFLASKTMIVYNCDHGCGSFTTQYIAQSREREAKNGDTFYTHSLAQAPSATPFCQHCGFKTHLAGPMWGGPLHNPHFITKILNLLPSLDPIVYGTIPRMEGMLTLALNETLFQEPTKIMPPDMADSDPIKSLDPALRDPHPFFMIPSVLARTLHCPVPSEAALRGALIGLGYQATRSHTEAGSIRTNAPWSVIWEIMREWVRQKHPIKEGSLKKGMAGLEIMRKDRSRRKLLDAKQALRTLLDDADDVETLQTGTEAALYRVIKKTPEPEDEGMEDGICQQQDLDPGRVQKELKVVFDEKLGREAVGKKLVRYQMNPRPDWGPMTKAKGS